MKREGLTITMIFLAESANYGEGIGNISSLKKMTRGNHEQYSYISRQAMRYNIVQQSNWDTTPVKQFYVIQWECLQEEIQLYLILIRQQSRLPFMRSIF